MFNNILIQKKKINKKIKKLVQVQRTNESKGKGLKVERTNLTLKGGSKVKLQSNYRFRAHDFLEAVFRSQTFKANNNRDIGY